MPRRSPPGQDPSLPGQEEMSMMKRLSSMVLTLAVCILMLPTQALAMRLRVAYIGDTRITLDAEPTDIAREVRARILEIGGLPADSPTNVMLGSSRLKGESTLQEFGAQDGTQIDCMATPKKEVALGNYVQIFLETLTGKHISIDVRLEDTVRDLKLKIQEKENIPAAQQNLIFNGQVLEDGNTLESYGIQRDSSLRLVQKAAVEYLDENGQEQTCPGAIAVKNSDTQWSGGWYVVDSAVEITGRVTVSGEVRLILKDGCELKAVEGINVGEGSSLTIYGQSGGSNMGQLTATGVDSDAGIGGGDGEDGGTITINGGAVTALVTKDVDGAGTGAGIGGGHQGAGGIITINGGKVQADCTGIDGDGMGAGIGGGAYAPFGTITINGGIVTADGDYGAGIGGGWESTDGIVTINGGTVNAASIGGAGIGGGIQRGGGTININGGTVNAVGAGGAAIGGGFNGAGGKITISGGMVTVRAGKFLDSVTNSAGIGCGGGNGVAGGEITISGGTVNATNEGDGAAIGGNSNSVTISGGTIMATSNTSGIHGNFSTGTNGNAFIMASSITDQSGKTDSTWSGVIFEGIEGNIYNSPITLTTDTAVPMDKTLVIGEGETLIIGRGVTLTNNGTITGGGTIINNGTIKGNPIDEAIHGTTQEWVSNESGHWHPCAVTDCAEHIFGKATHSFGDWTTDTLATTTTPGSKHRTCGVCQYQQTETIPATGGGSGGDSYTPPTYKPDVAQPGEGGAVSVTPSHPERGDTVTIKPKPDEGYEVDKITVTDKDGKPVEVTVKPDGTYTFKQPNGKVKIEVTYKPIETSWSNPFTDLAEDDWYYEAVRFVQEQGLMNGYSDGRFGPNDTLSRGQLAQILFNKEGRPGVDQLLDFSDVSGEAWYAEAVRWVTSQGIAGGYGNGAFGPNDPITREQLAVMLWRYSGSPAATDKELHFNDTDEISGYALEAMRWAVENGILNGDGDGRLGPQGQATRAQAAQMLKNFFEKG